MVPATVKFILTGQETCYYLMTLGMCEGDFK